MYLDFHVSSHWPFHVDWFDEWKHFLELHEYWKHGKCNFGISTRQLLIIHFHEWKAMPCAFTSFASNELELEHDFGISHTHSMLLKLGTCNMMLEGWNGKSRTWVNDDWVGSKRLQVRNKSISVTMMIFQFQVESQLYRRR